MDAFADAAALTHFFNMIVELGTIARLFAIDVTISLLWGQAACVWAVFNLRLLEVATGPAVPIKEAHGSE
jgi:hypothetical protein